MANDNQVIFTIGADASDAKKEISAVTNQFESLNDTLKKALLTYVSFQAITGTISKSLSAAVESESAFKSLGGSLAIAGKYSEEAANSFLDYASSLQELTGVQDEVITKNASMLVSIGKLSGDSLKQATKASLDLAAGLQMDVGSAFDVMAKAAQGNIGMLSRYGLEVRSGASDSEKFAAALDFVKNKFNDFSTLGTKGLSGILTQLSNSMSDTYESIGLLFSRSPMFKASMLVLIDGTKKFNAEIEKLAKNGDPLKGLIDGFFTLGHIFADFILKPIEILTNFFATGLTSMITVLLTQMGVAASVIDKAFGTGFADKVKIARDAFAYTAVDMATKAVTLDTTISNGLNTTLDNTHAKITEIASTVSNDLSKSFDDLNVAIEGPKTEFDIFAASFKDSMANMGGDVKKFGSIMGTAIGGFAVKSLENFGAALVGAGGGFDNFGIQVLKMIGQLAVQMGTFFLFTGLATNNPIFGFQGGQLMAAGAALIVLGGVIGGVASNMEGNKSQGMTATGGSTGGGLDAQGINQDLATKEERVKQQTGVTVNVQGNILDRRETGLAIAEIINEAFDTNGVLIRAT